jgi:hypothetical protein
LFVVFYTFSDNADHIDFLLHTVDVELGIGSVTTVDADGLQPKELFHDVTLLTEVHDAVQFNVVTGTLEYTVLDNELF